MQVDAAPTAASHLPRRLAPLRQPRTAAPHTHAPRAVGFVPVLALRAHVVVGCALDAGDMPAPRPLLQAEARWHGGGRPDPTRGQPRIRQAEVQDGHGGPYALGAEELGHARRCSVRHAQSHQRGAACDRPHHHGLGAGSARGHWPGAGCALRASRGRAGRACAERNRHWCGCFATPLVGRHGHPVPRHKTAPRRAARPRTVAQAPPARRVRIRVTHTRVQG